MDQNGDDNERTTEFPGTLSAARRMAHKTFVSTHTAMLIIFYVPESSSDVTII